MMSIEDFESLKNNFKEGDACVTNARGFWEKAPCIVPLWSNVGLHVLIKKKDVELLNEVLEKKDIEIEFSHYENSIKFPLDIEKFIATYNEKCFYSFSRKY